MVFDWGAPFRNYDLLLAGLGVTLRVSAIAFVCAFAIGLVVALARRSRFWWLRTVATVYVEVLRNTPVLLQIFVVFFGLPSVGIRWDAITSGTIALALNTGAYLAEIIRAGIQSISKGQIEAATSLGLSPSQVFQRVVFPQALRNIYPPVVNQVIMVEVFTAVTLIYVALTATSSSLLHLLGRRLFPTPERPEVGL